MMDTYQLNRKNRAVCWNCTGAGKFRGAGMLIQMCHLCDGDGWMPAKTEEKECKKALNKLKKLGLSEEEARDKLKGI